MDRLRADKRDLQDLLSSEQMRNTHLGSMAERLTLHDKSINALSLKNGKSPDFDQ